MHAERIKQRVRNGFWLLVMDVLCAVGELNSWAISRCAAKVRRHDRGTDEN
jgi:hypothetical protein